MSAKFPEEKDNSGWKLYEDIDVFCPLNTKPDKKDMKIGLAQPKTSILSAVPSLETPQLDAVGIKSKGEGSLVTPTKSNWAESDVLVVSVTSTSLPVLAKAAERGLDCLLKFDPIKITLYPNWP